MDSRFPKQEDWAMSDSDEEETPQTGSNHDGDSSDEEGKNETFAEKHLDKTDDSPAVELQKMEKNRDGDYKVTTLAV